MVDEKLGDEGVEQGFHRRRRRIGLHQVLALGSDHGLIGEGAQMTEAEEGGEAHGGVSGGLYAREVPAAALDVQHRDLLAEQVARGGLDRRITAAVQDELGFGAKQPRAVGSQRQRLGRAAPAPVRDGCPRLVLVPQALHEMLSSAKRAKLASQCSPM